MILLITLAVVVTALLYIALVRGYQLNIFLAAVVVADALLDVACQLWIDIRKLWPWKRYNSRFTGEQRDAEDIY